MKNTKNYEAPVAEMIEMQAPSVLMTSEGNQHQGGFVDDNGDESY